MAVFKPRNRLVNFRLTDEEFQYLMDACRESGARSVSDFARSAVLGVIEMGPQRRDEAPKAESLEIQQIHRRVRDLEALVQSLARQADYPALRSLAG